MNSETNHKLRYVFATGVVAASTLISIAMRSTLAESNLVMVYLLAVVLTAITFGKGPSVFASILAVAAFDFFCVPPYNTFAVSDSQYLITLIVMLIVALVISTLTARVTRQAEEARTRERGTAALYSMSRELSATLGVNQIVETGLRHLNKVFDGTCKIHRGNEAIADQDFDDGIARWVIENKRPAGPTTNALPGTTNLYLPIVAGSDVIGVYCLKPRKGLSLVQRQSLETFVNQVGLACERAALAESNEVARVEVKSEQLRNSLLSSVSHDLRTPLATISGAASSMLEATAELDATAHRELAQSIYDESVRLNRLVTNLLDMTRLQSGGVSLAAELQSVDELIGAAVIYMESMLKRPIQTHVPLELPFVMADPILIQQLLVNLIDNANKYSPPGGDIGIAASHEDRVVKITVSDAGPGVPLEDRQRIFEKFYRAKPDGVSGVGLGLAICKGIVEAHGGTIWVDNGASGGGQFSFTLLVAPEPPCMDDEE